jgi:hypothetical protein
MQNVGYFMAMWNILQSFGLFSGLLVHYVAVSYIFTVLVCFTKKNLATLVSCLWLLNWHFSMEVSDFQS